MASKIMYEKAKVELEELLQKIEANNEALQSARADGDLRENGPYQIAVENVAPFARRQQELEAIVKEPIDEFTGTSLVLGRLLGITYLGSCDANGNLFYDDEDCDEFLLLYEQSGDAVIDGILSITSPLGSMILGNRPDNYVIQTDEGFKKYSIKLADERIDEYLQEHPANKSERIKILMERGVSLIV